MVVRQLTRICFVSTALICFALTTARGDEVADREFRKRESASDPANKAPDASAIYWRAETARRHRSVKADDPNQQLIEEVKVVRELLQKLSTTNSAGSETAGDEDAARLVASAARCQTLVGVLREQKRLAVDERGQFERRFAQLENSAEKIRDASNIEKRQEIARELLQQLNEKEREKFRVNNVSPTLSTVGDEPAEAQ